MTSTTYLARFFEEKDLDQQVYELEAPGGTLNIIESQAVIERVLMTRGEEADAIANIIRKIDFMNGDVHHFLRHLAGSMVRDL